jgi:broad specificity phosphatase PhoE
MKWPETFMLIRHAKSVYNNLKDRKKEDALYQQFVEVFEKDPASTESVALAHLVRKKYALCVGDWNTPLDERETHTAVTTGKRLREEFPLPDVIHVSPYLRACQTLDLLYTGWPELEEVPFFREELIIEQGHGLANLYNDWRVFHVLHPEQRKLYDIEGPYWYRYPQGENTSDVRKRNRLWLNTVTREFSEKRMMVITHHLNILSTRANLERLDADEFVRLDKEEKPLNCGVTLYRGEPREGGKGKMRLEFYNKIYY